MYYRCTVCGGSGRVEADFGSPNGMITVGLYRGCPACQGTGTQFKDEVEAHSEKVIKENRSRRRGMFGGYMGGGGVLK